MAWAVISFFCGRYGREKGYSFWFSFLLCLLGQLIGLLAVLLLPDIARIRADAVGRDRAQDQEIATLKARLAVLESGSGTPAGTRVESPPAGVPDPHLLAPELKARLPPPPSFPPGQMRSSPVPAAAAARRAIGIPATPVACRFDMNRNDLSEVRLPPGLIFLPLWDNLATKTFFNCEVAHHE